MKVTFKQSALEWLSFDFFFSQKVSFSNSSSVWIKDPNGN